MANIPLPPIYESGVIPFLNSLYRYLVNSKDNTKNTNTQLDKYETGVVKFKQTVRDKVQGNDRDQASIRIPEGKEVEAFMIYPLEVQGNYRIQEKINKNRIRVRCTPSNTIVEAKYLVIWREGV